MPQTDYTKIRDSGYGNLNSGNPSGKRLKFGKLLRGQKKFPKISVPEYLSRKIVFLEALSRKLVIVVTFTKIRDAGYGNLNPGNFSGNDFVGKESSETHSKF